MTPTQSWLLVLCFVLAPSVFVAVAVWRWWDSKGKARTVIRHNVRLFLARRHGNAIVAHVWDETNKRVVAMTRHHMDQLRRTL